MSVRNDTLAGPTDRPLANLEYQLTRLLYLDGERIAYLVIFVLAVMTRFWDLGGRVMSHDESLHTKYSWDLYRGNGFAHTPLMHGPLLFHAVALSYLLFGDNDFSARLYPAILGIIVVFMPLLARRWLGKVGALAASFLFLISPSILYYSRYIRHDIPAILAALVMAIAAWHYIEDRKFWYLIVIGMGQAVLFASKEVSFIYIAIFGSFLTLYFVTRLFEVQWDSGLWKNLFIVGVVGMLIAGVALGAILTATDHTGGIQESQVVGTIEPLDPSAAAPLETPSGLLALPIPALIAIAILGICLLLTAFAVLIGQWHNLRRFPELDVMMVMATLVLPALTPFLIHFAGFNPMDSTPVGISRAFAFTTPVIVLSVVVGLVYFAEPPRPRRVRVSGPLTGDEAGQLGVSIDSSEAASVEVQPDIIDWVGAIIGSRWWAIGGPFWLFFLFFFTTMFTNGNGVGTGLIGSLGYWLEQQEVKRGGQPWYYYLLVMVPIYEFLPAILSIVAGAIGLRRWVFPARAENGRTEDTETSDEQAPPSPSIQPDGPIQFPILMFVGYWIVLNLIAYSFAGEKMPWLTTHLTTPMILLAGWVAGQQLTRIRWQGLWEDRAWPLLILVPLFVVALLRTAAPLCGLWPVNPACNTVIPISYQTGVFAGRTVEDLAATGVWFAALIVLLGTLIGIIHHIWRVGPRLLAQFLGLFFVGWLTFLTARAAWTAAYINYDYANEYLVYAHSSGAVKDVLDQIDEISYKTTDGLGLRVAYDNRVSWPMSWYFRNYYNAVYYGDQPSRGLIGDAPVILAGPSNWPTVESIVGNRYYQFEYIRMWWPMQDYFDLSGEDFLNVLKDPALQRGIWDIFINRDYDNYADAVTPYRPNNARPNFELSQWPVAERMRFYIRKDVFAQVWDYGVAASEIAEAIDPYAENVRQLAPENIFGQDMLNQPHGIDFGPDGNLYVADSNNHRILVFDPEGHVILTFGQYGLAPTPNVLNEPWDVAVAPDGSIFVADTWNHRVVKFTSEGQFVTTWGSEGPNQTGPTSFWGPRGIDIDAEGLVYVADTGNKRVMVYDGDGAFVRQIGSGGSFDGELDEPVGIAVGPDGMVYVADTWNQRIQVFDRDGLFMRGWTMEAWYAQSNQRPYLDVDLSGNLYVTDPDAGRVIVFNSLGQYLYSFGDVTTIGIAGGVAVDTAGHLFIIDTENGGVQRYFLGQATGTIQ